MSKAAAKYLELIDELRLARLEHELRLVPFAQDEEVEYVAELDHWWREMTGEEQDAIERFLAVDPPGAPAQLPAEDVDVEIGSDSAPRREAA
ncbi:MAG: hypothetical protein ACREJ3_08895 [Polyangiaceae bacterium]